MSATMNQYTERLESVIDYLENISEKLVDLTEESDSIEAFLQCIELMSKQLGKEVGAASLIDNNQATAYETIKTQNVPEEVSEPDSDKESSSGKKYQYSVGEDDPIGRDGIDSSSVNLSAYVEDFKAIHKSLIGLGLYWDDSEEYYSFIEDFGTAVDEIVPIQPQEAAIEALKERVPLLRDEMYEYKYELTYLEYLSDEAKRRIRLINRLDFLFYKLEQGITDPRNDYNYILAEKGIQMCLCDALNGEHHQEYLGALLDEQFLFKVARELADARPAVQKYGKAVPTSKKLKIIELDEEKTKDKLIKSLGITDEEFLSFSETYKEFLKGLK